MQFKQIVLIAAALLPFASGVVGAPAPVAGELYMSHSIDSLADQPPSQLLSAKTVSSSVSAL